MSIIDKIKKWTDADDYDDEDEFEEYVPQNTALDNRPAQSVSRRIPQHMISRLFRRTPVATRSSTSTPRRSFRSSWSSRINLKMPLKSPTT